ncbi:TonB-dependent receptor [Sphingomonas cavernae]|nr:TonB-dependent receptor [Sphingomonas cavernae]
MIGRQKIRGALLATAIWSAVASAPALAAEARNFSIRQQSLADALRAVAMQSGTNIIFDERTVAGRRAPRLDGRFTPEQAVRQLLQGTEINARLDSEGAILVSEGRSAPEALASGEDAAEEIVVTGSRIARAATESNVPVTAVSRLDIEASGSVELSEILLDYPGVTSGINIANSRDEISSAGLSTIDLRNLGDNRTLILIDGRRTVSNSVTANRVSTSTIPTFFIERTDIVTGGASAVYGSDAIAGVVNIITLEKYDGVKLGIRYGTSITGGGGDEDFRASILAGKSFLDDRASIIIGATYEKEYGLMAYDRDRALTSISYNPATNTTTSPAKSTTIFGGRFRGNAFFYDETGLKTGFVGARDGYETRDVLPISVPRTSRMIAGKFNFAFSDAINFFSQVQFSDVDTWSNRDFATVTNSTTFGQTDEFTVGTIARTNPFVPTAIATGAPASGITFSRRLKELGERVTSNDRDTLRAWAGFKGNLGGGWSWEASYGYGKFTQHQERQNLINLERLKFALAAERDPANPAQIRCINAQARADGCVPVNLFGVNSMSAAAADYIRTTMVTDGTVRQDVVQAFATGPLFNLPGGPLRMALGAEYRTDKQSLRTDEVTRRGVGSASFVPEFDGKIKAKEAFIEFDAPILSNVPFADSLSFDAAFRIADYSVDGVGTVFSYKAGGEWAPVRGLRFRGQYARAQRSPDLTELFSPPRDDADTVVDICDGVTATTQGVAATNCRAIPAIAAAIAANGSFEQETTSIQGPNSGNPDLKEETADTITFGAVLTPTVIPGFSLTVDYFNIKIKDAIDALDNPDILRECYLDPDNFPNNAYCGEITRDGDGQLTRILNRQFNLNSIKRSGIDVAANYVFMAPQWLSSDGQFSARILYSRLLKSELEYEGRDGTRVNNFKGEIGDWVNQGNASISYADGPFYVRWTTNYTGKALDSRDRRDDAIAAGITNPLYLYLGDRWRHDAYVSMEPEAIKGFKLYAGIRNLFNSISPFLPDGTVNGDPLNFSGDYDVAGRSFYAGIEFKF